MIERIHPFTVGGIEGAVLQTLDSEHRTLRTLLADELPAFEDRTVEFAFTLLYAQHRGRHVLVDGGIDGDEVSAQLATLDVAPEDVGWVLITHVDRDHVAGLILQVGDGVLTYPNARYVLDAGLWGTLHDDGTYTNLPKHLQRLYWALVARLEDRVILCDGETEVADGITFVPSPGHRPGHAAYALATEAAPLLHVGDAFLHPVFLDHPDWPAAGDTDRAVAAETRAMLRDRIERTGSLVVGSHFPSPGRLRCFDIGNGSRGQPDL